MRKIAVLEVGEEAGLPDPASRYREGVDLDDQRRAHERGCQRCWFRGSRGIPGAGPGAGSVSACCRAGAVFSIASCEINTDEGRADWQSLIKATEQQLVLAHARPGVGSYLTWPIPGR
jgi:hypothetical protein